MDGNQLEMMHRHMFLQSARIKSPAHHNGHYIKWFPPQNPNFLSSFETMTVSKPSKMWIRKSHNFLKNHCSKQNQFSIILLLNQVMSPQLILTQSPPNKINSLSPFVLKQVMSPQLTPESATKQSQYTLILLLSRLRQRKMQKKHASLGCNPSAF